MGYPNNFNPTVQTNKPYTPTNVGNPLVDPNKSLIPDCNVLSLAKERVRNEMRSFLDSRGYTIYYKRTGYSFDNHDFLLGEDPTSPYHDTKVMKGFVEIKNNVHFFSPLGDENKKEIVLTLSIEEYQQCWGSGTYPTNGDIFFIKGMDCGDIEKESEEVYRVTDKKTGNNDTDILFGGYVWRVNAIRFDYSYEPNAFIEKGNTQPNDDVFMGILSGGESPVSADEKQYDQYSDLEAEIDYPTPSKNIYGN